MVEGRASLALLMGVLVLNSLVRTGLALRLARAVKQPFLSD